MLYCSFYSSYSLVMDMSISTNGLYLTHGLPTHQCVVTIEHSLEYVEASKCLLGLGLGHMVGLAWHISFVPFTNTISLLVLSTQLEDIPQILNDYSCCDPTSVIAYVYVPFGFIDQKIGFMCSLICYIHSWLTIDTNQLS